MTMSESDANEGTRCQRDTDPWDGKQTTIA